MDPTNSGAEAKTIRKELEEILASEVFSSAHRSQSFLRYVVERSLLDSPPKEYEIAVEVLGRGAEYDPAIDATVRVEASRLRGRLLEYYATHGQTDSVLIEVPKGGYRAIFRQRALRNGVGASAPEGASLTVAAPGSDALVGATATDPMTGEEGTATAQKGAAGARHRAGSFFTRISSRMWFGIALGGIAGILVALLLFHRSSQQKGVSATQIRSLAVLPLQNLSSDAGEDYFADGMTDELTTELAHIPDLRVVSRTSAMQSKGSHERLRQIAQELGVDAVVEGSVVRSGGRVRITAQLIDARDDRHLWAQTYEETMQDVLSLQDRVVRDIAFETRATLAARRPAEAPGPVDPAAYDAYLRGLYFLHRREAHKSAEYFQKAVSITPAYAAAYAGLAEALGSELVVGEGAEPNTESQALAAAARAIALDPDNGDAYAALAWIEILKVEDWATVKRDLDRSIRLSPSNPLGELEYSIYLDAMNQAEEAVVHMRRALQLDPLSFYMNRQLGSALYFARHYDEALFYLQRANEMEPRQHGFVDSWASRVYELTGNLGQAEHYDLLALSRDFSEPKLKPLRTAFSRGGWKAYHLAKLDLLSRHTAHGACGSYEVGQSYLRLGKRDEAFSWLTRGVDDHCFWASTIPVDPLLDSLRSDPRYGDLLRHAHL